MNPKLHRRSYLIGTLMGVGLGIGVGYLCAVLQGVHRLGTDNESEVALGIAAMRKLDANDTAGAQQVLQWVVADRYLNQIEEEEPLWFQAAYRNSRSVEQVEKAAKDLPGLAKAIEERRTSRSSRQAASAKPH